MHTNIFYLPFTHSLSRRCAAKHEGVDRMDIAAPVPGDRDNRDTAQRRLPDELS